MSGETNPPLLGYASPTPLAPQGAVYRDGAMLLVRVGSVLPRSCVLCGEASTGDPVRLTFTWDASFTMRKNKKGELKSHQPILQLRQKGEIFACMCGRHGRRFTRGRIWGSAGMGLATMLMLIGLVIGVIGESSMNPKLAPTGIALLLAGFALFIVALFYFTLATRTLSCSRIEAGYLRLEGAGSKFLRELPNAGEGTDSADRSA